MVVLSLYKKTQIGYTQYVDNDVYVYDVDDDEAGAGAYLLLSHSDESFAECSVKPVDCMPKCGSCFLT